jgi:hypothetical protein
MTLSYCRRHFLAQLAGTAISARRSPAQPADEPDVEMHARMFPRSTRYAIQRGLTYLADNQNEDGSFGRGGYSRNVGICGLCGMAMLANGSAPGRGPFGKQIASVVDYLLSCCQKSGYIVAGEASSGGPMYGHGFATLFLADVHGMSLRQGLREKLSRAVQLIVNSQSPVGGWRYQPNRSEADVSVTVCQVMALRAARNAGVFVPNETIERAAQYVRSCQNEDGGFRYIADKADVSAFARSAAAVVALYGAGMYEGDEIKRGLAYLLHHPPTAKRTRKQEYFFYGHYYAVQAMWQARNGHWEKWYPAIREILIPRQEVDGSWFDDSISFEYGTAMSCLILQMPNNYLPIFRR